MSRVNFDQLLEAGVHFGHLKRKWNPAMAPYIFMERNGIHIIDLYKTVAKVDEAAEVMKNLAKQGKKVLFVATKKQAKQVVADKAASVGMPIVDLTRLPSALFVVDVMKEHIAVREANRLGIPVFGMVDTNSNPNNIDYVIPANDDATKSVEVILGAICEAMNEGLQERKAEKIDAEAAEEAPKRERKAKAAVKKERTKKEDDDALNANVAGKFAKDEE